MLALPMPWDLDLQPGVIVEIGLDEALVEIAMSDVRPPRPAEISGRTSVVNGADGHGEQSCKTRAGDRTGLGGGLRVRAVASKDDSAWNAR